MGIPFQNPVGLAAGLDKNASHIDALGKLGFGFIEVGTITPRPQPGNPRPRLFRLPEAQGIINRFGFNNIGVDAAVENIRLSKYKGVLGINIGKNFDTPIEKAAEDYILCMKKVYQYANYIAVNISSPNTKNLRDLQETKALNILLAQLKQEQTRLNDYYGRYVPIALKISPDLTLKHLDAISKSIIKNKIDGVSLLPIFNGNMNASPRKNFLYYYRKNSLEAVRRDNWKLVFEHPSRSYLNQVPGKDGFPGNAPEDIMMPFALYDLRRDPAEAYDVKDQYPEIVIELNKLAEEARKELGDDLQNRVGAKNRPIGKVVATKK
jgi:hypothetical protein